jgi:CRP/FNR family transcriptional regulator, cyclic AMP receptor protein
MSKIRNALLPHERGLEPSQVVEVAIPVMAWLPPLWEAPVAFLLSSLEKAGMPIAERRFGAEETIYIRGDPDQYLYFVTEGVIKLYKNYGGQKEAIVTMLEEGNIFGEPTPHSVGAHRDSAEAASACQVAVMNKAALEQLVQRDTRCALALIVAYAQWVQRNERAMERLLPRDIRPRLAASLLELADRLGEPTEGGIVIGVHLIHQTLADMAVSSRVGVSKEMARLRREGLIETRGKGRIVLLDKLSLEEIARNRVV